MSASALAKTATVLSPGTLHCTSGNPEFREGGMCQPGDRSCGTPRDRPIAIVCGRDNSDRIVSDRRALPASQSAIPGCCLPGDGQPAWSEAGRLLEAVRAASCSSLMPAQRSLAPSAFPASLRPRLLVPARRHLHARQ